MGTYTSCETVTLKENETRIILIMRIEPIEKFSGLLESPKNARFELTIPELRVNAFQKYAAVAIKNNSKTSSCTIPKGGGVAIQVGRKMPLLISEPEK